MKREPEDNDMMWLYVVIAIGFIWTIFGCASRPQTCPPHDTRCQVLLLISTVDIGPKK